jgi:hypothetical protein
MTRARDVAATVHVFGASQVRRAVFLRSQGGVGLVSCVAQLCDGRAESRAYAETFRRMPRSDHRNSLVRMGTHPRNDDQDRQLIVMRVQFSGDAGAVSGGWLKNGEGRADDSP